jgi:hypothetical protein
VATELVGREVEVQVLGNEVRVVHFCEMVAAHGFVASGEVSAKDEHYDGTRRALR